MCILPNAVFRVSVLPIKIWIVFFIEIEQKILKLVWNQIRPHETKLILRKKEQSWRYHTPLFHIITKQHVLAAKQVYRSIEQNGETPNKSTHIWTIMWQRSKEFTLKERIIFSINSTGKTGQPLVKGWK